MNNAKVKLPKPPHILFDAAGHPITIGDKVYSYQLRNIISEVITLSPKTIKVAYHWADASVKTPFTTFLKPKSCVVITQQLEHNVKTYPENYI